MASIEKISIALPQEMVEQVREAVDAGEYASTSEVVREALRDWNQKRALHQQGLNELRRVWKQAAADKSPGIAPDKVLDRLEQKYRAAAGRVRIQKREKCA
jgi:Predicted transcriptional regulators containing the CopG/Arc/MetJ DNA-binding domain and a metal-binding domain